MRGAILHRTMDRTLARRAVVIGHLIFAAPAIAAILLVPFLGLYMFGPFLFVYYVLAGVTFGWQWYALALPGWKRWLARNGVQDEEAQQLTHRAGLAWLGEGKIGPFALHATAAAVCGVYLGPWLLSRWFVWILPLAGSIRAPEPARAPARRTGYRPTADGCDAGSAARRHGRAGAPAGGVGHPG